MSPAADCLTLLLYKNAKDRFRLTQPKGVISLRNILGIETGFTVDKESNTIAIICGDKINLLAFDTRESLVQWKIKIQTFAIYEGVYYLLLLSSFPPKSKMVSGPVRMHIQNYKFCLTSGVPPRLVEVWELSNLRRYGVVDNRFCFEGGSSCGRGQGLFVFLTDRGKDVTESFTLAAAGRLTSVKRSMSLCRKLSDVAAMNSRFPKSASTFYIKNPSSTISYRPDDSERDDNPNKSNPSQLNYVMSRSWTLNDHKIFRSFDHYDSTEMAISMSSSMMSESDQMVHELAQNDKYENYDRPNSVLRTVQENYDTPRNFNIVDSGYESLNVSQDHDYEYSSTSNYGRINRTNLAHYENSQFLKTLENYENSRKFATSTSTKIYQSKTLERISSSNAHGNYVKRSSSTDFMDVFDHKLDQQFICRSQMNEYVQVQPFLQRIQFKFESRPRLMRSRTFDRSSMRSSVRSSTASSELSDYMDAMSLSNQTYETGTQKTAF